MAVTHDHPFEKLYEDAVSLINEKLGTDFSVLDSFPTRDPEVAKVVLPIVANVASDLRNGDLRHSAYLRFHTPHAYRYLADTLRWFETETDPALQATLTAILALLVKARDAEHVWNVCSRVPKRQFHYLLMKKLAGLRPTAAKAKDSVVADLEAGVVPDWELQYVEKIRDPRIDDWFTRKIDAVNIGKDMQTVHRRRSRRKVPAGITRWPQGPEWQKELTSAEVNLTQAGEFLAMAAQKHGFILPEALGDLEFLESAASDKWFITTAQMTDGRPLIVWLRAEDYDVVEIVITKESPT